jgi:hypothetical protein
VEYEKANPQDIVDLCYDFHRKYCPNIRFLVDGSNAGFVRQLKVVFGEDPDDDYEDVSAETMECYQRISVQNISKCYHTCI